MGIVVQTYKEQFAPKQAPTPTRPEFRIGQVDAPLLTATPSPGAFGAQLGATVEGLGEQAYAAEVQKADQVRLTQAERQLSDWELKSVYDPQAGALNVRGEAAMKLPDQVATDFDKTASDIRSGLANDNQKLAFDRMANARRESVMGRIDSHVAQQGQMIDQGNTKALVDNERQIAVGNADATGFGTDPDATRKAFDGVETGIANQQRQLVQYGQRNGWTPEMIKNSVDEATSKTHEDVIKRFLDNGADTAAKVYYEHVQGEILGDQRGAIEAKLSKGQVLGDAQRISDTIKAQMPNASQTDLIDAVAKKTNDPETRKLAEEQLRSWGVAKREDQRAAQEAAAAQAKATMDQLQLQIKNSMDRAGKSLTYEQVVPQSVRDLLPEAVEKSQREYFKMLTEKGKVDTDLGTYYNLLSLSSTDATKDDFARTNLMQYVSKLDASDFKHLADVQAAIRKGDDETANKLLDGYRTPNEIISDALLQRGENPNPKPGTDEAKRLGLLRGEVDKQIADIERRTQKKASRPDIQGIVDNLMIKGSTQTPGWLWGTNTEEKYNIDVGANQPFSVSTDAIPAAERSKIETALGRANLPVNDNSILKLYLSKIHPQPAAPKPAATIPIPPLMPAHKGP